MGNWLWSFVQPWYRPLLLQQVVKDKKVENEKGQEKGKAIEDPTATFVRLHRERFHRLLQQQPSNDWNANVDAVFGDKTQYDLVVRQPKNALEKVWAKRMLTLYTPRGNVTMHYDPYKLGFVYYADQFMPYAILNAVAMRYCMMFRCLAFFVDEWECPQQVRESLVYRLLSHDDDDQKQKQKQKQDDNDGNGNKARQPLEGPFLTRTKSSNNNNNNNNNNINNNNINNNNNSNNKNKVLAAPKRQNTFVLAGKVRQVSLLRPASPPPMIAQEPAFASDLLELIPCTESHRMDYRAFKKRLQEPHPNRKQGQNDVLETPF